MNIFRPITVLLLLSLLLFILIGNSCEPVEEQDYIFDEDLINQHLEAEVTFQELYRPQFHFTPRINWMNDPNGLVYFDGQYHLFHQYNPFGNTWGFMSWGHAVSDDLVHWDHQPVAIPYGKDFEEAIFSGSAIVDHENTSGFGDGNTPPMVAIYTSHYTRDDGTTWQAQSLAYSTDGGETFTKFEGNPVLEYEDSDFRDPNVIWMDDMDQWLMVVALPTQYKVQFYASDNLIDWEYLSDFGPAGAVGGIWECPDLFLLPVDNDPENSKWVLHVDLNPGSVAGGSGSQYFIGEWDGTHFIPEKPAGGDEPLWVDYGTDFYAAITWNNIPEEDGRRLWVGWMNNWEYANEIPTHPWRSMQSIPRSIHLETVDGNIQMVQRPVEELKTLRQNHISLQNVAVSSDHHSLADEGIAGKAYEMIIDVDPGDADRFGFKVRAGDDEETVIEYDALEQRVIFDRTNSGASYFNEQFARNFDAPVSMVNGSIRFHFFVDWSSVELFINDGATVFSTRIFPEPDSDEVILFSEGGEAVITNLDYWELSSIWD